MKCEEIGELLPDYLQGSLRAEQDSLVERHLVECADCREEVAIWKKLSLLPVEKPSAESGDRFEAMLQAYQTGRNDKAPGGLERPKRGSVWNWLRSPVGAVAWSAALLVIGVFAGNYFSSRPIRSNANQDEIAAMHIELSNMKQMVVLSMLQQQSASERLQGVSYSRREDQLDPQVMSALVHTLRYDGSVDVRLAALDALSRHGAQPQVHKGVVDALQEQQSPLVQVALIDLMLEWRDPDAAQRLRNFVQTPNLNPTVKQRAEWAVSKLN
ncbi:MAG TPA: zf-HC2 domain-containing protein [Candidatus Acidoferrum sp.]|nr:zf-HC2 domain-containing protein [Candidatus Acidoferrum sp.]